MKRLIAVLVAVVFCQLGGAIAAKADDPAVKHLKPCVVISGADSHVTKPRYLRITSVDDWVHVWQEHKGHKPFGKYNPYRNSLARPTIDFESYMIIGIFQGASWNSDGLRTKSIFEDDKRIVFRYDDISYQTLSRAGSGEGANKVTVYGFFVLPRSNKPVVIEENVQNYSGEPPVWKDRITFPEL